MPLEPKVIPFPDGTDPAIPGLPPMDEFGLGVFPPALPMKLEVGSPDFRRAFRFGLIDNAALVLSTLAGLSLEDWIAERIGVPGYGALVGAAIGNAISDGLAGIPEGRSAALGYFGGALLPVLPLAVAMGMKKPPAGTTGTVLKAASIALLVLAFVKKKGAV
jgi:hypothetical protein